MKEQLEGFVVGVEGAIAKVRLTVHAECEDCGMCLGDNAVTIDADNQIGAKLAHKVMIEVEKNHTIRAAFIVYMCPLLAAVLGVIIAEFLAPVIGISRLGLDILGGCIFFALAVIAVVRYDKAISRKRILPKIIRIIY